MSGSDSSRILNEISDLRNEMNLRLDSLEKEIKAEMTLKHQEIDFKHTDHERRLSFTEKALMTTVSVILLSVLYAVLRTVGL